MVNIHAFCLMPNHYHLLLSENIENGIPRFMKKLNMGYALYFNEKYEREGALFQGRYKSAPIVNEAHFIHIPYYIHLNPLDLKFPSWRAREINNWRNVINYLNTYRWSSYLDYIGIKNFPSVTQRDFLNEYFESPKNYISSVANWLKNMDLEDMGKKLLLE
ncbi:MAG: transposase [Patescibacteria group bacterium]